MNMKETIPGILKLKVSMEIRVISPFSSKFHEQFRFVKNRSMQFLLPRYLSENQNHVVILLNKT